MRATTREQLITLGVVLFIPLFSARGQVSARQPMQLHWEAPTSCPTQEEVRAGLEQLLGSSSSAHSLENRSQTVAQTVDGVVTLSEGRWNLVMRIQNGAEETRKTLEAESCPMVARAFELLVALTMDPQAALRAAPESTPPAPVNPSVQGSSITEGAFSKSPEAAGSSRPPQLWASTGIFTAAGPFPSLGSGVRASVGAIASHTRWELTGTYWLEQHAVVSARPTAGADLRFATGGLLACRPVWGQQVLVEACGGAEVGGMRAMGFGVSAPTQGSSWWVSLDAAVAAHWLFTRTVGLQLGVDTGVPLFRPEFFLAGFGTVHRPAPVYIRGNLQAEVYF